MPEESIELLVTGGAVTGGPPIGPALGPYGIVKDVVAELNKLTKDFQGMKVPVVVRVNKETKEFRIEIKTPMTSALILRELGVEKGSGEPNTKKIGDLSIEQVAKIARIKSKDIYANTFKNKVKCVLGTMLSMGVTVNDGMDPRIVQQMIDDGEFDDVLKEEVEE
ncbi:MAG: 50S ribosomal protein L11 [Promethearchaeota archaeon]